MVPDSNVCAFCQSADVLGQNLEFASREPLLVLDGALKVVADNPDFYNHFKNLPEWTEGRMLYELRNRQWDIPRLRELLEQTTPQKATIADFSVEHNFPGIGFKKMLLNARRFHSDQQKFIILPSMTLPLAGGRKCRRSRKGLHSRLTP
jgi:hypothetical protein